MPKIPKKAKRVFKGVIFDVYQWKQKMFDGSHATFEAIKRQDTVIVLPVTPEKQLVLLKQEQPGRPWFFSTVAGRMDVPGETVKQTAVRELLEETGMKAKKLKLWKILDGGSFKIEHNIYIFVARDCIKVTAQKLDAGEKIEVFKHSFDQFLKIANQASYRFIAGDIKNDLIRAYKEPKYRAQLKKVLFG